MVNKGQFGQRPAWNKGLRGEAYKKHYKNGISNTFTSDNVSDDKHPQWKGERASYTAIHQWLYRKFGKATECEECGTTEAKRFEWANISGEYRRERSDWKQLCSPCHHRLDDIARRGWITRKAAVCV